ncbi:SusC/RagA family TonB-linked outer membrane protein [Compostibacter hankyongensis]|uniref:SusC/RagA family TonB-linked outer membrane protein n=1 Tax=Compostibacter hankyongensis TaxID=1007089 RepID=A0ABP8FU76_9BACT
MSPDGKAVPAATVQVKGTEKGAVADQNGSFTLQAAPGTVLVAKAIGLDSTSTTVGTDTSITITMQGGKTQTLKTVVVKAALGMQKNQRSVGYAIQEVSGQAVQQAKEVNFVNALNGKIAGVQINTNTGSMGGSSKITIRGQKSILGDNNALFVVDGVPFSNFNSNSVNQQIGGGGYDYGNPSQDINPDDIETISVLKGAAATALYGTRGANGVVLITTKKGGNGGHFGVNYSLNIQTDRVYILPKYQNRYGGGSSPDFDTLFYNKNPEQFLSEKDAAYHDPALGAYDLLPEYAVDESWGPEMKGQLVRPYWSFDKDKNNPDFGKTAPWSPHPDNARNFFTPGLTVSNNISAGNDFDKGSVRISFGDMRQKFILPHSKLHRDNISLRGSYEILDNLTASASFNYANTGATGRPGTGFSGQNIMEQFSMYGQRQLDMNKMKDYKYADGSQITWNRHAFDDPSPASAGNPYWERYEEYESDQRNRYYGFAGLDYKPIDWLNISGKVMMDSYNTLQEERTAKDYLPGSYARNTIDFREMNYQLLVTANPKLSEDFSLDATAGGNIMKQTMNTLSGLTSGGLVVPGLYTLSNSLSAPLLYPGMPRSQINSLFADVNLGYKNTVFLEATGRNDWSSTLPADSRSFFYPSVSASIVFSEWLKNWTWLSFGKLRGSYAVVGTDASAFNVYNIFGNPILLNGQTMISVDPTKRNPNLKPERTTEQEVGLQLNFLDNRIGLDVAAYNRITRDQIIPVNVSPSTGFATWLVNAGRVRNRGVEVHLEGSPVRTKDFTWTLNLNLAKNENKVLGLAFNGIEVPQVIIGTERRLNAVSVVAKTGYSLGTLVGYDYKRINGKPVMDSAGNYTPTDEPVPLGSVYPDYTGGVSTNFTYKNFSLSALVDFQQGGKFFSYTNMYGLFSGLLDETAKNNVREDGVTVEGVLADGTPYQTTMAAKDYFKNDFGKVINSANVYDASYVYLREVKLGYNLPKSWADKIGAENIAFYLYGRNLWLISKNAPNVDPSNIANGSGNIQGLEGGALPSVRSFGLNLNVGF